ncbi:MAG: sugar-binding transcriptional regulator [Actinobacteria bacterium]|nr:sugar-binding transcriptional regulator [Actinomycetota bacterium]
MPASEERLELLGQIVVWYYEENLDQREIALRIGKSRSMVSRLLHEARDAGLVQIRVKFPLRSCPDLEERLVERFGLMEARVLDNRGLVYETLLARVGRLAARSLQGHLHSDMRISVGWGASLFHVVRAMPEIQLRGVSAVQMMGSIGQGDPAIDGSGIVRLLAEKLNGDYHFLATPLLVDQEETAQSLLSQRAISHTLDLARRSDVAITGIGSVGQIPGIVRAGYFDQATITELQERGIVGDLLGFLFDDQGRPADLPQNRRVVAMPLEDLTSIPFVMGVAAGKGKATAILAVLRGGYLNGLVTDSTAAEAILHIDANKSVSEVA